MTEKDKLKILFLCTGNSCRSQMAEGWARKLKSDCIEPFSAGVYPVAVSLRAIKIMAEAGVDITEQYSKHVDDLKDITFDYVITLCDNAKEFCPVYSGKTKLIHKPFSDPSFLTGSDETVMNAFRKVRDGIRDFIFGLPQSLEEHKNHSEK
jgi:arsenate reductase (thioredoxin)